MKNHEEKQLLLVDLCARLPYGVYVRYENGGIIETRELGLGTLHDFMFGNADIKPYLRPMYSMTEEEKKEYKEVLETLLWTEELDFYNSHHLDYRGLIEKGLALEAPEGMYVLCMGQK